MKAVTQLFHNTQSVLFFESVLGILRRDTNLYLKLTQVANVLVEKNNNFYFSRKLTTVVYGALWCPIHKEVGHSSNVW